MTPEEAYGKCLVNNKRDKNLEQYIIKDPGWAYLYARFIIKDRWIEAEDIISTDSKFAFWYAEDVIKGKLTENMHNMMLLHADDWAKYYFDFIKNNPQP